MRRCAFLVAAVMLAVKLSLDANSRRHSLGGDRQVTRDIFGYVAELPVFDVHEHHMPDILGNCEIGRVESVVGVDIEHPSTSHDEIAVFLNNHRIRLQTTAEGLDHVEVES